MGVAETTPPFFYSSKPRSDAGRKIGPRPSGTENHALTHAEPRAAGASHALLHAHRVKTARTRPRAHANTRAAPRSLCHGRKPSAGAPWPSRAARTSHAPLAPPEAGARPLTPRRARRSAPLTAVCAHCTSACTFFRHHTAPERDATGKTLHREARAAARRARRPPSTLSVTRAGLLCSLHAACTAALF